MKFLLSRLSNCLRRWWSARDRSTVRAWLTEHRKWKADTYAGPPSRRRISIITPAYNVPPVLFAELADSILGQSHTSFEWVLIDNGSTVPASVAAIRSVADDPRVRYSRLETNRSILPCMRLALEQASGDYIVPVDADDRLEPDALAVLLQSIEAHNEPAFLYSDEAIFDKDGPVAVYLRPDWDPVLNLCTSYVFHLCAFRRDIARREDIYGDKRADYVADWNALLLFSAAGHQPVHVPAVLYHWRMHGQSSTNRAGVNDRSLECQHDVLSRELEARGLQNRFDIRQFPIFRGAPEWWYCRKRDNPEPIDVIMLARDGSDSVDAAVKLIQTAGYPFRSLHFAGCANLSSADERRLRTASATVSSEFESDECCQVNVDPDCGLSGLQRTAAKLRDGLTLICDQRLIPDGDHWPWEAIGLRELHPDILLIAGRILNSKRRVLSNGEIFGFGGLVGCPDRGRVENDPGYFGLALKQRTVDAVDPRFFLAETSFLRTALAEIPESISMGALGAWLGMLVSKSRGRSVATPLVTAVAAKGLITPDTPSEREIQEFISTFGDDACESKYYSQFFCPSGPEGYRLRRENVALSRTA